MGKGTIITSLGDGEYTVELTLMRERFDAAIASMTAQIATLTTYINILPYGTAKTLAQLKRTALQKRITYMEANFIDDPTVTAWCADSTDDLTGAVGTIEVPGERGTAQVQPGYDGNAAYDSDRDGQLARNLNLPVDGAGTFYNLAMLPGWQKWKPTFRYGTITAKPTQDTADVTLDAAISSQQDLDINQSTTLSAVPISYETCDGGIFGVSDEVLVRFNDQDWTDPEIVGFKDNPKACATILTADIATQTWTPRWKGDLSNVALTASGGVPPYVISVIDNVSGGNFVSNVGGDAVWEVGAKADGDDEFRVTDSIPNTGDTVTENIWGPGVGYVNTGTLYNASFEDTRALYGIGPFDSDYIEFPFAWQTSGGGQGDSSKTGVSAERAHANSRSMRFNTIAVPPSGGTFSLDSAQSPVVNTFDLPSSGILTTVHVWVWFDTGMEPIPPLTGRNVGVRIYDASSFVNQVNTNITKSVITYPNGQWIEFDYQWTTVNTTGNTFHIEIDAFYNASEEGRCYIDDVTFTTP